MIAAPAEVAHQVGELVPVIEVEHQGRELAPALAAMAEVEHQGREPAPALAAAAEVGELAPVIAAAAEVERQVELAPTLLRSTQLPALRAQRKPTTYPVGGFGVSAVSARQ